MERFIGKASTTSELSHLLDNLPYDVKVNLEELSFCPEVHDYVEVWFDRDTETVIFR